MLLKSDFGRKVMPSVAECGSLRNPRLNPSRLKPESPLFFTPHLHRTSEQPKQQKTRGGLTLSKNCESSFQLYTLLQPSLRYSPSFLKPLTPPQEGLHLILPPLPPHLQNSLPPQQPRPLPLPLPPYPSILLLQQQHRHTNR